MQQNKYDGEVAEWLMAPVLKTGVPERVPGVRIPPSPPALYFLLLTVRDYQLTTKFQSFCLRRGIYHVTLAYLKGKDAESEDAQEHANTSSLALYA